MHNKNANGGRDNVRDGIRVGLGGGFSLRFQGAGGLSPGGEGGERGRKQAGNKRQLRADPKSITWTAFPGPRMLCVNGLIF